MASPEVLIAACSGGRSRPSFAIARQDTGAPLASMIEYVKSESTGVILIKRIRYVVPDTKAIGGGWGLPFNSNGSLPSTPSRENKKILSVVESNFIPGSKTMRGPVKPS